MTKSETDKRFNSFLKQGKIKKKDLAEKLGVGQSTLCSIDKKRAAPKKLALSLQALYNLNPEWLLEGKEPMYLPPSMEDMPPKLKYLVGVFNMLPGDYQKTIKVFLEFQKDQYLKALKEINFE